MTTWAVRFFGYGSAGGSLTSRPAAQYMPRTTSRWKWGFVQAFPPWRSPV